MARLSSDDQTLIGNGKPGELYEFNGRLRLGNPRKDGETGARCLLCGSESAQRATFFLR
jgi:hypothetical protein